MDMRKDKESVQHGGLPHWLFPLPHDGSAGSQNLASPLNPPLPHDGSAGSQFNDSLLSKVNATPTSAIATRSIPIIANAFIVHSPPAGCYAESCIDEHKPDAIMVDS
jgi:hypothetical protein